MTLPVGLIRDVSLAALTAHALMCTSPRDPVRIRRELDAVDLAWTETRNLRVPGFRFHLAVLDANLELYLRDLDEDPEEAFETLPYPHPTAPTVPSARGAVVDVDAPIPYRLASS